MRILLFSYWGLREGITQGAVFPLLNCLAKRSDIELVVLCTVELPDFDKSQLEVNKAIHVPFTARGGSAIHKVVDLFHLPRFLKQVSKRHRIDLLWCKGAPAGGAGALTHLLTNIPFVVDSFEPHSAYMIQSGTWSKFSPKYMMQIWLEKLARRFALALLPVSREYFNLLEDEGIDKDRLFHLPCVVNINQFKYNAEARNHLRTELGVDHKTLIGIYVGKYGGLYHDVEAFILYRKLFHLVGEDMFLILLTDGDARSIRETLVKFDLPQERILISKVPHSEVSYYLSAADFAISTIKSVPAMRYCSPIKHGEYWAADLPIISTLGVGDDANVMRMEGGGIVLTLGNDIIEEQLSGLRALIRNKDSGPYSALAYKYRNPAILNDSIDFVLNRMVTIGRTRD